MDFLNNIISYVSGLGSVELSYMFVIVFMFALAIIDLTVGVSNDAVNFLSSAVGSKAAKVKLPTNQKQQNNNNKNNKNNKRKFDKNFNNKQNENEEINETEEIITELKDILKRANLESKEVFRASELKNRIKNSRYLEVDTIEPIELKKSEAVNLKKGDKIYSKTLGSYAIVSSVKPTKKEVEVFVGNIRSVIKFNDVFNRCFGNVVKRLFGKKRLVRGNYNVRH